MSKKASFTKEEVSYYSELFNQHKSKSESWGSDCVLIATAIDLLSRTGIEQNILMEILKRIDRNDPEAYSKTEFMRLLQLSALYQATNSLEIGIKEYRKQKGSKKAPLIELSIADNALSQSLSQSLQPQDLAQSLPQPEEEQKVVEQPELLFQTCANQNESNSNYMALSSFQPQNDINYVPPADPLPPLDEEEQKMVPEKQKIVESNQKLIEEEHDLPLNPNDMSISKINEENQDSQEAKKVSAQCNDFDQSQQLLIGDEQYQSDQKKNQFIVEQSYKPIIESMSYMVPVDSEPEELDLIQEIKVQHEVPLTGRSERVDNEQRKKMNDSLIGDQHDLKKDEILQYQEQKMIQSQEKKPSPMIEVEQNLKIRKEFSSDYGPSPIRLQDNVTDSVQNTSIKSQLDMKQKIKITITGTEMREEEQAQRSYFNSFTGRSQQYAIYVIQIDSFVKESELTNLKNPQTQNNCNNSFDDDSSFIPNDGLILFEQRQYKTFRRYKEFENLLVFLRDQESLKGKMILELPAKSYLTSSTDEALIAQRIPVLENFLQKSVEDPEILKMPALRCFLLTTDQLPDYKLSGLYSTLLTAMPKIAQSVNVETLNAYLKNNTQTNQEIQQEFTLQCGEKGAELQNSIDVMRDLSAQIQNNIVAQQDQVESIAQIGNCLTKIMLLDQVDPEKPSNSLSGGDARLSSDISFLEKKDSVNSSESFEVIDSHPNAYFGKFNRQASVSSTQQADWDNKKHLIDLSRDKFHKFTKMQNDLAKSDQIFFASFEKRRSELKGLKVANLERKSLINQYCIASAVLQQKQERQRSCSNQEAHAKIAYEIDELQKQMQMTKKRILALNQRLESEINEYLAPELSQKTIDENCAHYGQLKQQIFSNYLQINSASD